MTALYDDSSQEKHAEIAEAWRPFRGWVSLLLRAWWDQQRGGAGMSGYMERAVTGREES
jgi:hypothetical protein